MSNSTGEYKAEASAVGFFVVVHQAEEFLSVQIGHLGGELQRGELIELSLGGGRINTAKEFGEPGSAQHADRDTFSMK